MVTRQEILEIARSFIGTPFHHAARAPGIGMDCAGVLICAARAAGVVPVAFDVPPYTRNPDGRTMQATCDKFMRRISTEKMAAGDAVLMIVDQLPQHLGILGDYRWGGFSLIHASNQAHPPRVIETRLMWSRAQRFVCAYSLVGAANWQR